MVVRISWAPLAAIPHVQILTSGLIFFHPVVCKREYLIEYFILGSVLDPPVSAIFEVVDAMSIFP